MQDDASNGRLGSRHHAAEVVAQRRQQYGPPEHFKQVARRWSLTIGTAVRPERVVLCLPDLSVVRLTHDPRHLDSISEVTGCAGCLAEVSR